MMKRSKPIAAAGAVSMTIVTILSLAALLVHTSGPASAAPLLGFTPTPTPTNTSTPTNTPTPTPTATATQIPITTPMPTPHSTPVPPQQPELLVIKTSSTSYVVPGDTFNYTIEVTNLGQGPATNVTLTDQVPSELAVVEATVSQGSVTVDGNLVQADIGVLGPSYSATLTIVVQVRTTTPPGVEIANIVTGDSDQTGEHTADVSIITASLLPASGNTLLPVLLICGSLILLGIPFLVPRRHTE